MVGINSLYGSDTASKKPRVPMMSAQNAPVTQASTMAASDAQVYPRSPIAAPPKMVSTTTPQANPYVDAYQQRAAARTQQLNNSPEQAAILQAAKNRELMRQNAGAPLAMIQSAEQGRAEGLALADKAIASSTPESRSPIAGLSPIAGDAAHFNSMAQRESAERQASDQQYTQNMQRYNASLKADANGNGIPDRDESVASKFGNLGIHNVAQLTDMDAKHKVYLRGYAADKDAQASTRPMSFDEFVKNEQENYKRKPVYGVDQPAGSPGDKPANMAYEQARSAALQARDQKNNDLLMQRMPRIAQAQQLAAARQYRADALARGYTPQQADYAAQVNLAQNSAAQMRQNDINSQLAAIQMQDSGATNRAGILAEAQKFGSGSQLAGVLDTNQSNVAAEGKRAEASLANIEARSKANIEEARSKLIDPATRVQTISSLMQMHPNMAGENARQKAEMQFTQAYPQASLQQVRAAGQAASQAAAATAAPMWNAIMADPEIKRILPSIDSQGLPPVSTDGSKLTGTTPISGYSVPPPPGVIPEPGWKPAPEASPAKIQEVVQRLQQFKGSLPTEDEVSEALLAEGLSVGADPRNQFSKSYLGRLLSGRASAFDQVRPEDAPDPIFMGGSIN